MTIAHRLRIPLAVIAAIVLIAVAVWAVGAARTEAGAEADRERPVPTPQRVFTDHGQTVLRIDAATLTRSGIVTTNLAAGSSASAASVFATVVDTTRLTDLANLWTIGAAQADAARARAAASNASLARTRLLYADSQNASLAQLQAAQATYAADRAGADAARAQASAPVVSARQEFGPALTPGSALVAAIVARRTLLLQVALPPDAGAPPQTLMVEGDGGLRATARLIGAAAKTDPRVPGRGAYYSVPASSGLVPGMNVTAQLAAGGNSPTVTAPASAVVNWQGKAWIYRRCGDGALVRVGVVTDQRDAAGNYLLRDLAPNTPVVTQGAQLLLSEELRSQAPVESDGD